MRIMLTNTKYGFFSVTPHFDFSGIEDEISKVAPKKEDLRVGLMLGH